MLCNNTKLIVVLQKNSNFSQIEDAADLNFQGQTFGICRAAPTSKQLNLEPYIFDMYLHDDKGTYTEHFQPDYQ